MLAMLLSSGCSESNKIEQLCQANIEASLINPETAQFFEFSPISERAAVDRFYEGGLKMRGTNSGEVAERYGAETQKLFRETAEEAIGGMAKEGAGFFEYRVKAGSRLGLTVTTTYTCGGNTEECACFDAENLG